MKNVANTVLTILGLAFMTGTIMATDPWMMRECLMLCFMSGLALLILNKG